LPVETRYFRSDQQTINGLNTYLLGTSQTTTSKYTYGTLVSCSSAYLYPTGDAYAGFPYIYPTTPTTHYDKVDEEVADDDATYVYGIADGHTYTDRYYKTTLSIGTSKIAAVDIIIRYKGAGIKVGFYIGGTLYPSSALTSKTAWTTTSIRWLKNPATGNDWTQDDVNNAQLVVQATTPAGSPVAAFTQVYIRVYYYTDDTVYFQFRVFKRDASGVETAITDYITFYSALISVFKDDAGTLRSTTTNIPQTALASTDSIVVRVYTKIGTGSPIMRNLYTTEQLGAQSLDASTWTFYFYLKGYNASLTIYDYWYWDSTYPSRIENFKWTPYVPVVKIAYSDGLVCVLTAILRRFPSKPLLKCFQFLIFQGKCFGCRLQPRLRLKGSWQPRLLKDKLQKLCLCFRRSGASQFHPPRCTSRSRKPEVYSRLQEQPQLARLPSHKAC
jgi:hypothetical protein